MGTIRLRFYVKGGTVRILLRRRGWTQEELARRIKMSGPHLCLVINGKQATSTMTMNKILQVFRGVSHKPGGRVTWDDLFECKQETLR